MPTNWEEVSVKRFIAAQKIEDTLLPLMAKMAEIKEVHDATLSEIEVLHFAVQKDEFAALDLAQRKTDAEALEKAFAELQNQYHELSVRRAMALASLDDEEYYTITDEEAELLKALTMMLYDQTFIAPQPHLIESGIWQLKAPRWAGNNSVKAVFYLRHLADYPTCLHQVYHALLKQINALTEQARMERTEAELELMSLFVLPKPDNIIYSIFGTKPDKIDFSSGKFNEQLQSYWKLRQSDLAEMPITFLKGVVGFFLPHWTTYFKSRYLMQV
mgnify:CR=1 FL=1